MKNIADIASVSYRAYKACRWAKRKLIAHVNSHRKREDLSRMHMKPWITQANATHANATNANTTEANTTDATRPTVDEERNSIQVNVVNHLSLAQSNLPGIDLTTLEFLRTKGIVLDKPTVKNDLDEKKLGKLQEALCAHPPLTKRQLDATLPDDLQKLEMRFNQGRATRCAV